MWQLRKWGGFSGLLVAVAFVLFYLSSTVHADPSELKIVKDAISSKKAKWVAGETSVSKLDREGRKKHLGWDKPDKDSEEAEIVSALLPPAGYTYTPQVSATSPNFDWRNLNGINYVTPVKDQGNCGGCWAFATTAALESQILRGQGASSPVPNMAEEVLLSCSGAGSCNGGYIDGASTYIRNSGLPPESCLPYSPNSTPACSQACSTRASISSTIANWYWVSTGFNPATVAALKDALVSYGPLITTMRVYSDYYYYKSGIYRYTSGKYEGGHAVLLVGYDDANQCFIVKNSWGIYWGEAGYFRIAYSEVTGKSEFGSWTIAYDGTYVPVPQPAVPPCIYNLSSNAKTFYGTGGTGAVWVKTNSGCTWKAAVTSGASWIRITSGARGTGTAKMTYRVAPNYSYANRKGKITIAGKTYTIYQYRYPYPYYY